jgi:hypothetical protein
MTTSRAARWTPPGTRPAAAAGALLLLLLLLEQPLLLLLNQPLLRLLLQLLLLPRPSPWLLLLPCGGVLRLLPAPVLKGGAQAHCPACGPAGCTCTRSRVAGHI